MKFSAPLLVDLFDFSGTKAIVVGGNGLVGNACVNALHNSGAHVVIASRSINTCRNDVSGISSYSVDVCSENDFANLLDFVEELPGELTTLVNCAIFRPMKRFLEDSLQNWDLSVHQNARSIYVPSLIFARRVLGTTPASVINISSIYGCVAPNFSIYHGCDFETEPDYSYNKFGMNGLTQYFSSKFAKTNIRFNAIALGGVANSQPDRFIANYALRCPMGRLCRPEEIATSILYLASKNSSYTTGLILHVDGGWSST